MRTDLIQVALVMAMALRGERLEHEIFHSDRDTQYASAQITAFAKQDRITRSMGDAGVCWDNAMAESLFATFKTEFYHRRVGPSKNKASRGAGAWVEDRHRHTALGQVSPVDFELQYSKQTAVFAEAA